MNFDDKIMMNQTYLTSMMIEIIRENKMMMINYFFY